MNVTRKGKHENMKEIKQILQRVKENLIQKENYEGYDDDNVAAVVVQLEREWRRKELNNKVWMKLVEGKYA